MPRSAALKPVQVPADSRPTLDTFTKNIGSLQICWRPFRPLRGLVLSKGYPVSSTISESALRFHVMRARRKGPDAPSKNSCPSGTANDSAAIGRFMAYHRITMSNGT
jgi:hypothetical protein